MPGFWSSIKRSDKDSIGVQKMPTQEEENSDLGGGKGDEEAHSQTCVLTSTIDKSLSTGACS